jgi:hypothetical protein
MPMAEIEEGMNFLSQLKGGFGLIEGTRERLKAERRAGLTPKQRAKKGPPKKQVNFRATAETRALIKAMSAHLDTDDTDVITRAIHAFAESLPSLRAKK